MIGAAGRLARVGLEVLGAWVLAAVIVVAAAERHDRAICDALEVLG